MYGYKRHSVELLQHSCTNILWPFSWPLALVQLRRRSSPPLSLFGQLLWREFFYTAGTNNPNFDRMEGNPICVQIPWDHNPEALAKWAEGRTGFPWIDAIMTQLRQEGWIHHLARHAVACFLTRGDLWISWESGMKVNKIAQLHLLSFFLFPFSSLNRPLFLSGVWGVVVGCGLERERRQLDVAVLQCVFPAVLPLLLSRGLRPQDGSQRRLHQVHKSALNHT